MKPFFFGLVFLSLVASLSAGEDTRYQSPHRYPANGASRYARELRDILETTHSVDAFVLTLLLASDADADPDTLIPLVIRNAERLGILGEELKTGEGSRSEAFGAVTQAVQTLHARKKEQSKPAPKSEPRGQVVPVPPWTTEHSQEKQLQKNDFRTPTVPPIREGFPPPLCEDPPDEASVLRAMPPVVRGVPYFYEEFRDEIQIVTELLVDKIDPPRFFPLVGPAQLHHCHWKCTIYYTETIQSNYPFPFEVKRPRVQVVYMDKDHLHLHVPKEEAETRKKAEHDRTGP